MQSLTSAHKYLKFGPLDPADASGGVSPGQLGTKDQFRFLQLVRSCGSDFTDNFSPSLIVRTGVQPFDRSIVLIHEVLCQANHFIRRPDCTTAACLMLPVH